MKNSLILLFFFIFISNTTSQEDYFQQKVDYKIEVTLDDSLHQLSGQLNLTYTNQSPDELSLIYFHLWPNAYSDRKTDLGMQLTEYDSLRFYFAPDKDLGNITKLDFKIDGKEAAFKLDKKNIDIGVLTLNTPLKPGEHISITTPFTVKIPGPFSRLGRVGQSYQITQWYPKPAVYDKEGWHPMPYLSFGEFYSEFGTFDVSITLPENYIVAATGTLQTMEEQAFLAEQVQSSNAYFDTLSTPFSGLYKEPFPSMSNKPKTIRYTAENVHDFAWFADKRFRVQEKKITLPSGKEVTCRAFFNKSNEKHWKEATAYLARSVRFYSEHVGEYPYPHATAVQSVYSLGAGMEYPMITLIGPAFNGKALDNVITHEVGHNWFYGILGSNERDHAWMDEGLNSYYENRYMQQYYPKKGNNFLPKFIRNKSQSSIENLLFTFKARKNRQQKIDLPAAKTSPFNYFINAYARPSHLMELLAQYVSLETFDKGMKDYYTQWKFKHPRPQDFKKVLEKKLNKNLNWLFDDAINSNKVMDYSFIGLSTQKDKVLLKIKNKGGISAPFTITGYKKNGTTIDTISYPWLAGFSGQQEVTLPNEGIDNYTIDADHLLEDLNRANNHIKTSGLFKKIEPIHFKLLAGLENDKKSTLFFSPMFGWNAYDKSMVGLYLSNRPLFSDRSFEFQLMPFYAIGSKSLAGTALIQYNILPKRGLFNKITIGVKARKFHYDYIESFDNLLAYNKITPFIEFILKSDLKQPIVHSIRLQSAALQSEHLVFEQGNFTGKEKYLQFFPRIFYDYKNNKSLHPSALSLQLEYSQDTVSFLAQKSLKASLSINKSFTYAPKKSIDFRLFIGGFLHNTQGDIGARYPNSFSVADQNNTDYLYDEYFFARNNSDGIWSQQIGPNQGGMRYSVGQNHSYAWSNKYIATLSITADLPQTLPLGLPVRPFFDLGYFATRDKPVELMDNILWVAGIELELIPDILEVYFPIISSKRIQNNQIEKGSYFSRISFLININKVNPWREIENYIPW